MGWQSCSFLVTPQQLEKALESFALVVDNACVPIDYANTPVGDFIKIYSAVYERLVDSDTFAGKNVGLLKQIAITTNLSDIKFGMEHELDGKRVKAVIHDKRSVLPYLAPFTFRTYTENDKLYVSTRSSYLAYCDSVFGYEINFPKFSQSDAAYYGLASEKELRAYPDYERFRKNILGITKPFSFRLNVLYQESGHRSIIGSLLRSFSGFVGVCSAWKQISLTEMSESAIL